jgi:hypothetical protein
MAGRNVIYDQGGGSSTINGLLKDDYVLQQIVDTVNRSTVLLSRIKSEKTTAGRKFIFPVQFGTSQGVGARGENKTLPEAGFGEYEQATGNVKYLYSTLFLTGQSMAATRGSKAAFAEVLKQALKDARDGLKLDVQRQVWQDGTGAIAKVDGVHAATTTLAVKDPFALTYSAADPLSSDLKTRLFKRNMNIYIDAATDQQAYVTAVNSNGTVTLSAAITAGDGDIIYRGNSSADATLTSKDNEIEGLTKMVSASGSYLGISRTGKPEWQGNVVQLADAISEEAMRIVLDTVSINGVGEPNLMITDHKTRRRYEALLQSQKRFTSPMDLEGGFKALEFDGMPLVVDKDAPAQRLWALNTEDITWMVMQEFEWMDKDGAVLTRVANKDAYEATLFGYKNLACKRPANQAVLYDIIG